MPRYFQKLTIGRVVPNVSLSDPWRALGRLRYLIEAVGSRNAVVEAYQEGVNYGTPAAGTVTFTSGSGAVGATIGGTLVTVTWATSDIASMAAFVAAVNADATAKQRVTAAVDPALASRCILTAKTEPTDQILGNAITLVLSGTGTTVSGATLTGGVTATANTYSF